MRPTRPERLEAALRDYDETVKAAIKELVQRGDKDFFWEQRVADFVEAGKALRRRHRGILRAR